MFDIGNNRENWETYDQRNHSNSLWCLARPASGKYRQMFRFFSPYISIGARSLPNCVFFLRVTQATFFPSLLSLWATLHPNPICSTAPTFSYTKVKKKKKERMEKNKVISILNIDVFDSLANLIFEFPELNKQCQFIFVPGPQDPWGGQVLPRPPIPEAFLGRMRSRVPNAVFGSNPCR